MFLLGAMMVGSYWVRRLGIVEPFLAVLGKRTNPNNKIQ